MKPLPRPSRTGKGNQNRKGAAAYSPALLCSTIGASGLNFSVRNGKRWDTAAKATVDLNARQNRQGNAGLWGTRRRQDGRKCSHRRRSQHKAGGGPQLPRGNSRAISSARLWRRRLYTCALSTSSSGTTLMESSSRGRLRA